MRRVSFFFLLNAIFCFSFFFFLHKYTMRTCTSRSHTPILPFHIINSILIDTSRSQQVENIFHSMLVYIFIKKFILFTHSSCASHCFCWSTTVRILEQKICVLRVSVCLFWQIKKSKWIKSDTILLFSHREADNERIVLYFSVQRSPVSILSQHIVLLTWKPCSLLTIPLCT